MGNTSAPGKSELACSVTPSSPKALQILREKLEFLLVEEAVFHEG